jgi:hypothetical protein
MSLNSSNVETSATIKINFKNVKTARSIFEALSPDNIQQSDDVLIEAKAEEFELQIIISSKKTVESLIATVDDLLSCIQAAEKALEEISVL